MEFINYTTHSSFSEKIIQYLLFSSNSIKLSPMVKFGGGSTASSFACERSAAREWKGEVSWGACHAGHAECVNRFIYRIGSESIPPAERERSSLFPSSSAPNKEQTTLSPFSPISQITINWRHKEIPKAICINDDDPTAASFLTL